VSEYIDDPGGDFDGWLKKESTEDVDTSNDKEFGEQDFLPAIYVTLARIYDLLAIVALTKDGENALRVLAMHEQGKLKGAPPFLVGED
jgi:hypothetical protein